MNCNVVKDLIPLYIDECCSKESAEIVKEHLQTCQSCRKLYETMSAPQDFAVAGSAPQKLSRINDWKASILQSALMLFSFAIIIMGVTLEAATPSGLSNGNGMWACSSIIPATGFLLSQTNWYFIRLYKNRKTFSNCSLLATIGMIVCGYIWAAFHYDINPFQFPQLAAYYVVLGIAPSIFFCFLSKVFSNYYAQKLGKE